ncbi:MAG: 2-oxoglutarate dehydrogenase E1 component, partial [Litorimonas sp.]
MAKRTELNQAFIDTDFLDGASALYLERMQAAYADNPASVDAQWRSYFEALGEDRANARANADGPSWKDPDWPPAPNGELTAALTGDWGDSQAVAEKKIAKARPELSADEVQQAARDSLNALMLIRAYRVRGHLIADLD